MTEYQFLEGRISDLEQKLAALTRDTTDDILPKTVAALQHDMRLVIRDIEDLTTLWESFKPVKAQVEIVYGRVMNQANCTKCGRIVARAGKCMCGTVHGG